MTTDTNVISLPEACRLRDAYHKQGKRIVALSGSFDILHAGHVAYLEDARAQGDALIVLLNSDSSVKLYKGEGRPIVSEYDRARVLAALRAVDAVVLFDEVTPIRALSVLQPDIYANGADWGRDCIERPTVESYGGTLHIFSSDRAKQSSTEIIERAVHSAEFVAQRAVFLDRDGTLIENKGGYLHNVEDLTFVPQAIDALRMLQSAGYLLIVVTNQSGVGRGYFTVQDMDAFHTSMRTQLAREGIEITAFYACTHHPDEGCACRKPSPSMLITAAHEHGLVLSKSWMVGDSCHDIEAGRQANVHTIRIGDRATKCPIEAHHVTSSLIEAAQIIAGARASR